ncbi:hypothetical protein [Pseudomonas syringae]|uniref:hypothetical protein n=1 Tax=Pseudomonas syringae TaxID=317 RepID=UPI000CD333A0|nr:hypothetical protein [Pseudomonas syringae]SOP96136.1 hypothetical protein CFBP2118_00832 [Pseudomonas syringae pv. syringae]
MHELLKVAIESAVLLFVPGPTNTLLLAAGVSKGFLKSAGLPLFELSGYVIAITFYSILIEYVSGNTGCLSFMKVFCAGYISYMSCKTWKLSGGFLKATETILGFNIFITALFNPKAFIVIFDHLFRYAYRRSAFNCSGNAGLFWGYVAGIPIRKKEGAQGR